MLPHILASLFRFEGEQEGQGMVEYALILVLVSVVAITALTTLGGKLSPVFSKIAGAIIVT